MNARRERPEIGRVRGTEVVLTVRRLLLSFNPKPCSLRGLRPFRWTAGADGRACGHACGHAYGHAYAHDRATHGCANLEAVEDQHAHTRADG